MKLLLCVYYKYIHVLKMLSLAQNDGYEFNYRMDRKLLKRSFC